MHPDVVPGRAPPRPSPPIGGSQLAGCLRRREEAVDATTLCAHPASTTGPAVRVGAQTRAATNSDDSSAWRRRGCRRWTGPSHQATSLRCQPFILDPGRCSLPWTSRACSWKRRMEPSPEVPWSCRDGPLFPLGWPPQAQGSVYGIVSSHMVCSSWYRDLQLRDIPNQYDGEGQRVVRLRSWN